MLALYSIVCLLGILDLGDTTITSVITTSGCFPISALFIVVARPSLAQLLGLMSPNSFLPFTCQTCLTFGGLPCWRFFLGGFTFFGLGSTTLPHLAWVGGCFFLLLTCTTEFELEASCMVSNMGPLPKTVMGSLLSLLMVIVIPFKDGIGTEGIVCLNNLICEFLLTALN